MRRSLFLQPHVSQPFLMALSLALGIFVALGTSAGASGMLAQGSQRPLAPAATVSPTSPRATATAGPMRPPTDEGVALAQIATVRVEARYMLTFIITSNSQSLPLPGVCSGLGVLVASTSPFGAGITYLLTTNQVLAQSFCQTPALAGATLKSITFEGANVYLSTAYAGIKAGTPIVTFTFPKESKNLLPATNGSPITPFLVPLTAPAGVTLHDYPTVSLTGGAPSQRVAVDLENKNALALNPNQLNAFALPGAPTPTPQAQAKDFLVPTTAAGTSTTLSPGTPLIDAQTGVLIGLAASGGAAVAVDGVQALLRALNPKPACPGDSQCLSLRWQQAMTAFYGSPAHTGAAPLLQGIRNTYPDFEGAQEFLNAALPTPSPVPSATPSNQGSSFGSGFLGLGPKGTFIVLTIVPLLLAATGWATFLYLRRARRRAREMAAQAMISPTGLGPPPARPAPVTSPAARGKAAQTPIPAQNQTPLQARQAPPGMPQATQNLGQQVQPVLVQQPPAPAVQPQPQPPIAAPPHVGQRPPAQAAQQPPVVLPQPAPAPQVGIFISYARTDSAFVDRLERDLRALGFPTWVDRRKLEGGDVWRDELEKAVDRCQVMLIVLSPDAVASKYVRMEYRYADEEGKRLIPLAYHPGTKVPMDLRPLQWVNFQNAYEDGLRELLAALRK